jgi:hypothetical protein
MDSFFERANSFKNNLIRGDFDRAKEKVDDNLSLINTNIKELNEYFFKMGSKKDNPALLERAYNKFLFKT